MLELHVKINGEDRPILLAVDELPEAFEEARKRFGGYLRAAMKRRIDGQNFAPLAASTEKAKTQAILKAEITRRFGPRKDSWSDRLIKMHKQLQRHTARVDSFRGAGQTDKAAAAQVRAIEKEHEMRAAVRRFEAAGITGIDSMLAFARAEQDRRRARGASLVEARKLKLQAGESREKFKYKNRSGEERTGTRVVNASAERRRLTSRHMRRYTQGGAEHVGKILGNLRQSARIKLDGDYNLRVFSSPAWSGVHNEGGPAGNNAQIPKREFLSLESEDLDVFVGILQEHMIDAIMNG